MAVHIDITKVNDFDDLYEMRFDPHTGQQRSTLNPLTYCLGMDLTLCVGITELTEKTIDEIEVRLTALYRAGFSCLADATGKQVPYARADLERHLGMRTNGVPKTRIQYVRYLGVRLLDEATRQVANRKKKGIQDR